MSSEIRTTIEPAGENPAVGSAQPNDVPASAAIRRGAPASQITAGLRVLVCGGRNYDDAATFMAAMYRLHRDTPIAEVVTGGATGADTMAALWAGANGLVLHIIKADWQRHGKAAGPLRNQEMLDRFPPNLVVSFPGGRGTADMIRRAKDAGFEVWNPLEELYA